MERVFIRIVGLGFVLISATGCGEQRRCARQYASAICSTLETCAPGVVSLTFGDVTECQSAVRERLGNKRQDNNCDFDSNLALECIEDLESMQCNALLSGYEPPSCEGVYQCDEDSERYTGLSDTGF